MLTSKKNVRYPEKGWLAQAWAHFRQVLMAKVHHHHMLMSQLKTHYHHTDGSVPRRH